MDETKTCPTCKGVGIIIDDKTKRFIYCPDCRSTGRVSKMAAEQD